MTKQERNELIIQDYKNGLTRVECAVKYGMSDVGRILKESGIVFGKKGGNRPRYKRQQDIDWINKQIIALTKQGWSIREIMRRYPSVNGGKIKRIKKQFGILSGKHIASKEAKNTSVIPAKGDPPIPYGDNCNVRPKHYSTNFSQVIWR
jgi:transposase